MQHTVMEDILHQLNKLWDDLPIKLLRYGNGQPLIDYIISYK